MTSVGYSLQYPAIESLCFEVNARIRWHDHYVYWPNMHHEDHVMCLRHRRQLNASAGYVHDVCDGVPRTECILGVALLETLGRQVGTRGSPGGLPALTTVCHCLIPSR